MKTLYDRAATDDLDSLTTIVSMAFGGETDGVREWVRDKVTLENVRVMRDQAGSAIACAALLPMGQYYGGRSVTMMGIAGVGVLPHWRAKGVGKAMMTEVVKESEARNCAISSLYPSTTALYRTVGYEQAGQHFEHSYPVTRLPFKSGETGYRVRPMVADDLGAVRACYAKSCATCDGALDRSMYMWERKQNPRGKPAVGYVVIRQNLQTNGDCIDGFVYLRQDRPSGLGRHDLEVGDFSATTPGAASELLSFLAGFSSMAERVIYRAGASHPLATLLAESRYCEVAFRDTWMLRILNVERAFGERGYPRGLSIKLTFSVVDSVLPASNTSFTLTVNDGGGSVTRGGVPSPNITADIRGLSQLYCGQFSPVVLSHLGRITVKDSDSAALAAAVFSSNGGYCDFF